MIVVGLMSGTSADGVDAVVVRLAGAPPALTWEVLGHTHVPHPPALRERIFAAFRPETGTVDRLCRLNFALGRAFGEAALQALDAAGVPRTQVALIGSHGQTLWHVPTGPDASTLQLGEPAVIAERTGIPVVSNFRTRDVAAGGQGAPLVAYVDALLLSHPERVRAAQNIGGIANVTYLPPVGADEGAFAFDTGPGNMLIDDAARRATDGAWEYDRDGALAAKGTVDAELLAALLDDAYLRQTPPKTTGRERYGVQFGGRIWDQARARWLAPEDIVATLTAFTAAAIARAYRDFLPRFPDEVIVSGGGARNATLMTMLRQRLAPAVVLSSDELGIAVEAKEALAFAVLAYETWHRRPGNLPAATGARYPVILGSITPAGTGAALPTAASSDEKTTEASNPAARDIDVVSTLEMVRLMNVEDRRVPEAVGTQLPQIAAAIDRIAARMAQGGRLIYAGAGTSGRLGILDASECPPTFNADPEQVVGRIAGGPAAVTTAVEGAEDDPRAGAQDVIGLDVGPLDSVVGIASSGSTPYVLGAVAEARERGAFTVGLTCNLDTPLHARAEHVIAPVVGPEVITGSTRLKAGTAQKLVLNMLSTGVMIRLGKTFGNLMVDVQPTNQKLQARARRIVRQAGEMVGEEITEAEAERALTACDGEVKTALLTLLTDLSPDAARRRLAQAGGVIRQALGRQSSDQPQ
jgi:anhydro-N-acetylmuramic acid kinase